MVKSKEIAERRMRERMRIASEALKEGMEAAPDPLDVLMKDPEGFAKKLADGIVEAIRKGKWQLGIKVAKGRDSWKKAIDTAGAHYGDKVDVAVEHAMEDYDTRKKCIEEAKKAIEGMPSTTRAQRIARSAKYLEVMGECMDRAKGLKK